MEFPQKPISSSAGVPTCPAAKHSLKRRKIVSKLVRVPTRTTFRKNLVYNPRI
uniref:hypothetical protein n=1 Tax=Leptospira yasudae TaxID=2202201 RepID=UPI001AEFD8F3|nr:hypothetical protein [Leptospira yasudae]